MAQSFEDAGTFGKDFVDNGLKSFAALSKGMQAITVEASDYSKQAFESASAAAEKVMTSGSIEKAFEAQADYFKNAYQGFVAQATRMSDLYAEIAKDAYLPFEQSATKAK